MRDIQTPQHGAIGQKWSVEARERHCALEGRSIVFAHQGALTQDGVSELVAIAEQHALDQGDALTTRKRLVGVLVEGLENAHRHVSPELSESVFAVLSCTSDRYTITVGNAMPMVTAALLSHRVSLLNEMDDTDVKEHYLKLLSNDARSNHGGAGLGLLTMARKSLRPLGCATDRLDSSYVGFVMELTVARS